MKNNKISCYSKVFYYITSMIFNITEKGEKNGLRRKKHKNKI